MNESTKKIINLISTIFVAAATIALIVGCVVVFSSDVTGHFKLAVAFALIALIMGAFYFAHGYQKNAAIFMKAFTILYTLSLLITLVVMVDTDTISKLYVTLIAISFGMMCVLVIGRDLGKKKSYILSIIVFALMFISFIVATIVGAGTATGRAALVLCGGPVLLSLMLLMMMGAKYADKDARGTK